MRISYWSSDVCASDLGDPVAALRIGVGLHRPREADVGNTVVDERDIAYAGLDDRAFAPDDLWARGIVRAEKPAPALLLARFGKYGDGPEILLGLRRQPAPPRPYSFGRAESRVRLLNTHQLQSEGGL